MYPGSFEYHRAKTLDEALALLAQYGDESKLIAGGHSLLPVMKLRFSQPAHLIDIRRVDRRLGRDEEPTLYHRALVVGQIGGPRGAPFF